MNFYEVSPVGVVAKDFHTLTYSYPDRIRLGQIVEIEVGSRTFIGVIVAKTQKPEFLVKSIGRILLEKPLPSEILKLHSWMSSFYDTNPGTVWQTILPEGLNKNRRNKNNSIVELEDCRESIRTNFVLNESQLAAIRELLSMQSGTAILHGVTGSGKTEVYKALALESARRGLSSIILVPEISLTAQLVSDFERDFDNVIVTHSSMTPAQRFHIWHKALDSKSPVVVIGPRSALFMPLPKLGLVVVDECHEPSYKQENSPRYNSLRVASVLANAHQARLILGSATPPVTDYYTAKQLKRPIIEMDQLARKNALKSKTHIVDLTRRSNFSSRSSIFSKILLSDIEKALSDKQQVLLFHNRRGSASITLCTECGWSAVCPRCQLQLTLHGDTYQLRCHVCGYKTKPPTTCPECKNADISHRGIGTKRIEEEVRRLFPAAKVKRFDGDTDRGQAVQDIFHELHSGEIDIIIGTQTIAKGLDLPKLSLVGIVQADSGLFLPDFSSSERVFQLIAQASGRVGRTAELTKVIIQTFQPDHPAVQFGAAQDYKGFYEAEIINRSRGHYPPFSHLLKLTCSYKTEKGAVNASSKLARDISYLSDKNTKILGPAPAFYEHVRGNYRWQITVRSNDRAKLIGISKKVPPAKWQVEIDPISLL